MSLVLTWSMMETRPKW